MAHNIGQSTTPGIDGNQTNTDTDGKLFPFPRKPEATNRLAQKLPDLPGAIQRAGFEQHCKLVTAKAGQRVSFSQAIRQQQRNLPEQLVASGVSAGVIDHLELIEIKVQKCMRFSGFPRTAQRVLQTALELAAVYQIGKRIVVGHIMQGFLRLATLASRIRLAQLASDCRHQTGKIVFHDVITGARLHCRHRRFFTNTT